MSKSNYIYWTTHSLVCFGTSAAWVHSSLSLPMKDPSSLSQFVCVLALLLLALLFRI